MIFEEMKKSANKEAFIRKKEESPNWRDYRFAEVKEYVLSPQVDIDLDRLIAGDYYLAPPRLIFLRKGGSNKKRKVYCFENNDRALLQYMVHMVMEKYDGCYSKDLYSFRKENDVHKLFLSIVRNDSDRNKYIVKADIHAYGESINTDILGEILEKWMADEKELYSFVMWLVTRNVYYRNGVLERGFTSVMTGNPLCNFLENIYLAHVDEILSERSLIYSRYTDDICMMCNDLGTAQANYRLMKDIVEKDLDLTFNDEKTNIIMPKEEYDLLGYKFGVNLVEISDNTFTKISTRLKHRANKLMRNVSKGKISRSRALRRMAQTIESQFYGLKDKGEEHNWAKRVMMTINTPERLKLLDQFSEDCLRVVGSGRKTNAKYRVRYEDMKKLGYKPLVHEYYHRYEKDGIFKREKEIYDHKRMSSYQRDNSKDNKE